MNFCKWCVFHNSELVIAGGILQWDGMFELEKILDALSPEFYISLLPAVHRNYELALHVYKAWKPFQLMWQVFILL